jgi:hypothetical protein
MKKNYSILAGLLLTASVFAQAPQKMSYQAVIRNSSNALITSVPVSMRISILQGTPAGTAVYVETQTPITNANGLVSLAIGTGTPVTGTFAGVNWAAGPYFIKTETDPLGGAAYTIASTNELMSVPYALFSASGTTGPISGFTHYLGEAFNGGIIYYLYKGSDGLEHGLIVALTESTSLAWQTAGTLVNANRSWDGDYNTTLMTGSPAAAYIAGLGAGWYLPSIDELGKLYYNRFETNKALFTGGNNLLSNSADYWSSSEDGATSAFGFDFFNGYSRGSAPKTNTKTVRGVRAF